MSEEKERGGSKAVDRMNIGKKQLIADSARKSRLGRRRHIRCSTNWRTPRHARTAANRPQSQWRWHHQQIRVTLKFQNRGAEAQLSKRLSCSRRIGCLCSAWHYIRSRSPKQATVSTNHIRYLRRVRSCRLHQRNDARKRRYHDFITCPWKPS